MISTMDNSSGEDGWKLLEPDVILFQTTIGGVDKPILHPILDDPVKASRIIANPVYEKLTASRAAQLRSDRPDKKIQRTVKSAFTRSNVTNSLNAHHILPNYEQTTTKPIEHYSRSSGTRTPRPTLPQRQPSPLMNPASNVSKLRTSRPSTSSRQSDRRQASLPPQRKSQQQETITDGTIRYVKSRHGFEVQHFMSKNCLKIDVFSKDACQEQDKPFREMLEKKQQYERLSKSIYSSEYYQNRWNELVKSYKYENLSHAEWAKQNYQELCLRTLYGRAAQREYADQLNYNEKQREIRAHSAFQQWRDVKDKERLQQQRSRLTTAQSQGQTETRFFGANASFTVPMTTSTEDLTTSIGDTSYRMSISTNEENELHTNSLNKTEINEQKPLAEEKEDLRLYDPDRWSIHSMLKRVVGLSEPLSKVSKSSSVKKASSPSASSDSGFESV